MNKEKANELISRIGMEFELASLLDSDESYERFEKTILKVLEKDSPRSVRGYGRSKFRRGYAQYRGKVVQRKTVDEYRYPRVVEEFKEFYGIGSSSKPVKVISSERNLSGQTIRNDIELIEMILYAKYRQDIWYGTI